MWMATVCAGLALGAWQLSFNESQSTLCLTHTNGNVRLEGRLSFDGEQAGWRIAAPRDAVPNRLALIDAQGDVQGYLAFQGDGDRAALLVYHRTAQNYTGTLRLTGELRFTPDSFACRARPPKEGRVFQMASGAADSFLNDALFDPERDCALLLQAPHLRITTLEKGRYTVDLAGRIDNSSDATWSFTYAPDYYRNRYVPYYKPLNRARCPSPPTGWMSWNTYFDQATAEDNLAEARIGKNDLQPFGMEFWSIESWQDNSATLPVSHFDNLSLTPSPHKFPDGMKKLASDIRALGFRPGIWIAPFGTGSTNFYLAHKTWFLHDSAGNPLSTWNGTFTIDPSQDDVTDYLRGLFHTAATDWGYEFFKIDGMSGRNSTYCAHFFERPEIRATFKNPACPNPFERCVRAFREGIGNDRIFLACQGHVTGPEAAYADAARTGADIVHPNEPPKWPNLLSQARCTLNQLFAHNLVFFSDPDTLLVGDFLGLEQARLSATVVALPGQMMFSGDKLARLKPERMRLLQQALPVCNVRPLDLFPVFDLLPVWDLKIHRTFEDWDVVALFNWTERDAPIGFAFAELGLPDDTPYALDEFWTQTYQGVHSGRFEITVPAHGVRLLSVHRAQPHPQFVGSDRHITQGGVELRALSWNADTKTLCGTVKTVGGFPLTLRFRQPAGFTFAAAQTVDSVSCKTTVISHEFLAVTFLSPDTQEIPFSLAWK